MRILHRYGGIIYKGYSDDHIYIYIYVYIYIYIVAHHYSDVIIGAMASQITSLTIVYSTVYSSADHRKHQSCTSLAFVRVFHR